MPEFMLYIRNDGSELPAAVEEEFLKACEGYIENLKKKGQLIGAQPMDEKGSVVSKSGERWKEEPYDDADEINAGYYHIRAKNLGEAIEIAKRNPEFVYRPSAKIEVRQIKTDEESTGYVYPVQDEG